MGRDEVTKRLKDKKVADETMQYEVGQGTGGVTRKAKLKKLGLPDLEPTRSGVEPVTGAQTGE